MPIAPVVFVIMPLAPEAHTKRVYEEGIEPTLRRYSFLPCRVDVEAVSDSIRARIRSQIAASYFCIADLSYERPNCYYEVGFAHALGKRVLFIKDEKSKAHFDLSDYQYRTFSSPTDVAKLLQRTIPEFLASPKREEDDENNDRFGRLPIKDGFRLCAEVVSCEGGMFYMNLEVLSLDRNRPLHGKVKFHLHHTYEQSIRAVPWREGKAVYELVQTEGPYTLGAEIEMTKTSLELDLATIPCRWEKWEKKAYQAL